MADIKVEVFREDVDNLTVAIMAVVCESVGAMLHVDRSIIVAVALANVACQVDATELGPYTPECTVRLKRITGLWVD